MNLLIYVDNLMLSKITISLSVIINFKGADIMKYIKWCLGAFVMVLLVLII
jgi:hypothetical protein